MAQQFKAQQFKSIYCSCQGPTFSSHHTQGSSRVDITPVSSALKTPSCSVWAPKHMWCTYPHAGAHTFT